MVHICMSLRDESGYYHKVMAVALCSLFENTSEKITVHVMHDSTVDKSTKVRLESLVKKYNNEVRFYFMDESEYLDVADMTNRCTVATLYRLKIVDVLPKWIEKVLYLDCDIVANLDIGELWHTNIDGYACAACRDQYVKHLEHRGVELAGGKVEMDDYVNAGVILFNLDHIRRNYDLFSDCISFLKDHPSCPYSDQDALNFVFKNKIFCLNTKFNVYTSLLRGKSSSLESVIYHFAGDDVTLEAEDSFEQLFFKYMAMLPWNNPEVRYYQGYANKKIIKKINELSKDKCIKKIYWGAGSVYLARFMEMFPANADCDYIVDNNEYYLDMKSNGMLVKSPDSILNEEKGKIVVLVVSHKYFGDIKKQLDSYCLEEGKNYFNAFDLAYTKI